MRERLSLWLAPTTDDPDLARGQYLLNLVLLGLAGPGLLFALISAAVWLATHVPASLIGALGGVGVQLFYLLAYWLGRRGQVRLAGYIPVIVLFTLMTGLTYSFGVGHAMLVGYAMVVLTAGALVNIGVAFLFAGLSTVAHLAIGTLQAAGGLPGAVPPSALVVGDGAAIGMGLAVVVSYSWLADRELSRALHREQALSADLEQRVAARTAELEGVNRHLQAEIAERERSEESLVLRNRELTMLYEAVTAINSDLSLDVVLQTVAKQMIQALGSESCSLWLWDRDQNRVEALVDHRTWSDGTEPPRVSYDLNDDHVARRVLETREPVMIHADDPAAEEAEWALVKGRGACTLLMFPWIARDQVLGLVELLDSAEGRNYTPEEIRLARSLAAQAAVAVENARLYTETERRLREQTALREAGAIISSTLDLETVLNRIAEQMGQAMDATSAYISSYEPESMTATVLAEYIGPQACAQEQVSDLGTAYPEDADIEWLELMQSGQHDVSHIDDPDLPESERAHMEQYGAKTILYIPLRIKGQLVGYVELWESRRRREFTPEEIALCHSVAQQAAIGIENAQLYEQAWREIAERKRAEEQVLRQNAILKAINRVFEEALTCETDEEVAHTCLVVAEELTGSQFGFIGEVNQAGRFDTIALSDPGWDACRMPRSDAVVMIQDMEIRGYRGKIIADGWSLIVNDPACHPDSIGVPEGHPPIISFLGVPLREAGRTIGMIALANKEGGYDTADQQAVEALSVAFVEALMRKRAERALKAERASLAQRVAERTAELSAANVELTQALRAREEILATMSHELRTPLNAILGLSEALQEAVYGPLNERQLRSLGTIAKSGRHLLELINDVLDMAKIGAGKLELAIGPVSVEPVCEASLQAAREAVQEKRLRVTSIYDSAVEVVQADRQRLEQILVNLLSNAVKFTSEGGEIGLEVVGDREREVVHFIVWDTGIGIPEGDLERLFEPFVQLDSSLSRSYEGTGLGLVLARHLTEMHGGCLSVETELGQGSRFTVSLPWQPGDSDQYSVISGRGVPTTDDRSLVTVLLAEDNEINLRTISEYLEVKGYRVIVARNGIEAVERAREERPDAILMDIQMPRMDGLEATRCIRTDVDPSTGFRTSLADVPIIALTALAMPGDRERCLEAGVDGYLSKPVSLKELVNVIEARLRATMEA